MDQKTVSVQTANCSKGFNDD